MPAASLPDVPSPVIYLAIFTLTYYVLRYAAAFLRYSAIKDIHSPPGAHWFWGHELETFKRPCGEAYLEWLNTYGNVVRIKGALGYGDILVVADPAALSQMYTRNVYNFSKSPVFLPLIDRIIGKGLVWAEGDAHKEMRLLLNPVFSAENVRGMEDIIIQSATTVVEKLTQYITENGGSPTVNVMSWTSSASLDVIGRVGFGHDFGCGTTPEAQDIMTAWRTACNAGLDKQGFAGPLVLRAAPFIANLPIKVIQAQGATKLTVRKLSIELAEKGMRDPESAKGKDLLSTLIRASVGGKKVSIDELLDHITTFVMVGHETTSAVLNFTLRELAMNPGIQAKLRAEFDAFGNGTGQYPTYDDFQTGKLIYLDAVTKEAMRMFPPSSHTERVAIEDDVLPLRTPIITKSGKTITSIPIKKGQLIYVPGMAINRLDSAWGPYASLFVPERWLSKETLPDSRQLTQGWSQLFTFSQGPRNCIGYRLALAEYKVLLFALVSGFVWEATEDTEKVKSVFTATLQPVVDGKEKEGVALPIKVSLATPGANF